MNSCLAVNSQPTPLLENMSAGVTGRKTLGPNVSVREAGCGEKSELVLRDEEPPDYHMLIRQDQPCDFHDITGAIKDDLAIAFKLVCLRINKVIINRDSCSNESTSLELKEKQKATNPPCSIK